MLPVCKASRNYEELERHRPQEAHRQQWRRFDSSVNILLAELR